MAKRHRGKFDPSKEAPYELSRSRIENFVKCAACFYLMQVKGIKFPSIPGYNINEATDILLKRDFNSCRKAGVSHPFLQNLGYGYLRPFQHESFEFWTQSVHFGAEGRFHSIHEDTNLKIGGGIDDVWLNTKTNQLHIIDYKSTSQKVAGKLLTLDDKWKGAYKRQMDLYIWIMNRIRPDVSDVGYFLYCDGDRFVDQPFLGHTAAIMHFKMSLLPYTSNQAWIEPTLQRISETLHLKACPEHSPYCEHGKFLAECLHK